MAEEMIESKEFTCPQCGSHQFGTHVDGVPRWDMATSTGTCHGYIKTKIGSIPCGFTWRRTDDAKYFKGTGVFSPAVMTAMAVEKK